MLNKRITSLSKYSTSGLLLLTLGFASCEKYLEIPLPTNTVSGEGAYQSDNTVGAVSTNVFYAMYNGSTTFSGTESIGYRTALYTDELQNLAPANTANQAFYTNALVTTSTQQWTSLYKAIYYCNTALDGINHTTANLQYRNQWVGELLFSRAYTYYYLVNLYGNVPLITGVDVLANNQIGRTPKNEVYQQIVADLKEAEKLLPVTYKNSYGLDAVASTTITNVRARPNSYAASALLARVYLEQKDWVNAAASASVAISNTTLFQLVPPAQTFLSTSKEMIWGLSPTGTGFVREYSIYNGGIPASVAAITGNNSMGTYGVSTALSESQVALFDQATDLRFSNWIKPVTVTTPAKTYYLPNKYKSNVVGTEAIMTLRLAEQYLIRAEARARRDLLDDAKADLDMVRTRAGFTIPTAATEKGDVIAAVLKERQLELFTEFGFRFADLKRTETIDAVMAVVAPAKGGTWETFMQYWPIPPADITSNPSLKQTPGYIK